MEDRRDFLKKSAIMGLGAFGTSMFGKSQNSVLEHLLPDTKSDTAFVQAALPYSFDALEPHIDKQTMEIHYAKHHKAYVEKLNAELLKMDKGLLKAPYTFTNIFDAAAKISPALRNNGGGHFNHSLFWELLKPNAVTGVNLPVGTLGTAISKHYKSFADFKSEFTEKAMKVFGSGWCWLIEQKGKLLITTTANQDNPMMKLPEVENGKILLALDVWEHAYYLKHQNKRADYVAAWWNVINWEKAEWLFSAK
jgi:superoxide dismutase, Fe-Mn family